jgi:Homeodomain-like domain
VYRLKARYEAEGEAAFEPRSRAPRNNPNATPAATAEPVLRIRKQLADAGHDAGADTIRGHLQHHHQVILCRATIHRTYAGTYVRLLVHELQVGVVDLATGELLRELTLDPTKYYQPIPPRTPK